MAFYLEMRNFVLGHRAINNSYLDRFKNGDLTDPDLKEFATEFYNSVLSKPGKEPLTVAEAMFNSRQSPFTDITVRDATGSKQIRSSADRRSAR